MKKFIVFILAILYLGLSTGATVNMHFCMGKLVGYSLFQNDTADFCSKCGMQKKASKNKCCKDENKIVKIEQDQKITTVPDRLVDLASIEIVQNNFILSTTFINSSIEEAPLSNAPPDTLNTPIFIRNCVFLI